MKTHQITPILTIILLLTLFATQVNAGAIQSNVAIFNITITASGGGNLTIGQNTYSVIIGEPVVGNVTTNQSQFRFGFFHSSKSLTDVTVSVNQPPILPTWIYPTNGTVVLDDPLIVLAYSSSDPESDAITYYIYQNGQFIKTSPHNATVELDNGTYNYSVAAFDGSKYSNNATTNFVVDTPLVISLAWALPVSFIYIGVIVFYLFVGYTLKDKNLQEFMTRDGFVSKEVVQPLIKGIKWLYLGMSIPLVLLGIHIASLIAIAGEAPQSVVDALSTTFSITMWISIITLVVVILFLWKMPLDMLFRSVKSMGGLSDYRGMGEKRRMRGKRGKI